MGPRAGTLRSRRRRNAAAPVAASKEDHQKEIASIESGLNLLEVYSSALKEMREQGQNSAGDVKLSHEFKHAPRDWSNADILSAMSEVIDEHPRPNLEFVLGVLGLSKIPETLDERSRSQGAKAYATCLRARALRRKKEAREKEERERREKKEKEELEKREKKKREEEEKRAKREKQEREEREKREKKEREEREKREKREREEKKKAEIRAKEKIAEEIKKANERKEAEEKKGRGKLRRGRRSRPPTRAAATRRTKEMDADQEASAAQMLLEVAQGNAKDEDAMEVDTGNRKGDTNVAKESQTNEKTAAKESDSASDGAPVPHADAKNANEGLNTREIVTKMEGDNESGGQPGIRPLEKQQPQPSSGTKPESKLGSAKRRKTPDKDNATSDKTVAKGSLRDAEDEKKPERNEDRVTRAVDDHIKDEAGATAATGKSKTVHKGLEDAQYPTPTAESVDEGTKAASDKRTTASPKVIEDAAITSALKKSAEAVKEERSDRKLIGASKDFADVGEEPASTKREVVAEKEAAFNEGEKQIFNSKENLVQPDDDGGVVTGSTAVKSKDDPDLSKPKMSVEDQKEAAVKKENVDGNVNLSDSASKPEHKLAGRKDSTEDRLVEGQGTKALEDAGEDEGKESTDNSKEVSATPKKGESKPKESGEADGEGKPKTPEQEAEDFMADVFGPEDGEGEKEEAEDENARKISHRYRFRGRRAEKDVDLEAEAAQTDTGTKTGDSADETQTKARRKREKPKSAARRTSRRMSNIRDEIVVAPTGRRMRRESRNLINGAWQLPNADQYLLSCVEVWERLQGNRITIPFREPVAAKDAPGYFDVVENPMDMRTVKERLQDGRISTPDEFYKYMMLICSNAMLFNDEDSDLYELAMELRGIIRKETKPIVSSWREAQGLALVDSESDSGVESQRKKGGRRGRKKSTKSKAKHKGKGASERRKRGREDDTAQSNKKRRTLRRRSRWDD